MNSGKKSPLRVKDFYHAAVALLKLKPSQSTAGFNRVIKSPVTKGPNAPILIWEKKELEDFLRCTTSKKKAVITRVFQLGAACIVFADKVLVPPEIEIWALKERMALFQSSFSGRKCRNETEKILTELFPKTIVMSGGLLQVYGVGILLIGDSGVGKSESSLELISRGHRFISDDVTQMKKRGGDKLIGMSPEVSRNFMEIRGLSIINIKQIFGSKSIVSDSEINLVIQLKKWEQGKRYDRLGLESKGTIDILNVEIPKISIPVAPGRNIATLIEVACKVHILHEKGYHSPHEIVKRLDRALTLR